MNDPGSRLDGPPTGEGDERFRTGPAKLFANGGVAIALDTSIDGRPLKMGMLFGDLAEHARGAPSPTASASRSTPWATGVCRR